MSGKKSSSEKDSSFEAPKRHPKKPDRPSLIQDHGRRDSRGLLSSDARRGRGWRRHSGGHKVLEAGSVILRCS
jgi:hypothetical protein